MRRYFGKKPKIEQGDIKTEVRDDLTVILRKGKQNISLLRNMHCSPADGNFGGEHGNAVKPTTIQGLTHMDCM
jgi:hypothetical protein